MGYELAGADQERITGAIDMTLSGEPLLRSPGDIHKRSREVDYVTDGQVAIKPGGKCRIRITPAAPTKRPLETALMEGITVARWKVEGETPDRIALSEGVYSYFIQRVNGRWLGFAVDSGGRLACSTIGVIARQMIRIHPDEPHPLVQVNPHSMMRGTDVEALFGGAGLGLTAEQDWVDYSTWEEHGTGCITTTFCSPTT